MDAVNTHNIFVHIKREFSQKKKLKIKKCKILVWFIHIIKFM